ncbi:hypothetical protein ACFO5R_14925 [Halosolutus amylolyticus]|uniref:Uncharacterized protein n=1 Tax=Halosolutus amylolyticus TaxID=2932267 RepID=A0ABD5PRT9_9EURY|nr:hypothetical protein [Halosolutus amylolyticus]
MNPPPAEYPVIEELYEEYTVGSVTVAMIGHPATGGAWILSDRPRPIER